MVVDWIRQGDTATVPPLLVQPLARPMSARSSPRSPPVHRKITSYPQASYSWPGGDRKFHLADQEAARRPKGSTGRTGVTGGGMGWCAGYRK
jgi:hypothetical protein